MDTPCIPEDHQLRREAINNINHVFADSKLTLICDRDMMEIDASNLTVETKESILAALLVCDWNVRAWTYLEAMRGRQNIHVLCKDEVVVCLKELLTSVNTHGDITLGNLFLSAQHLLPQLVYDDHTYDDTRRYSLGFLPIEEAAYALRHRHASRPGDDIVIWSLLFDETPSYTASELWEAQIKSGTLPGRGSVYTSYLISSIPRVQRRGLGWAPCQPGLPRKSYVNGSSGEIPSTTEDGALSGIGLFTHDGLSSTWWIVEFPGGSLSWIYKFVEGAKRYLSETNWILDDIRQRFLDDCSRGAIIRPTRRYSEAFYCKSASGGLLVGVLGSNASNDQQWTWKGVYDWKLGNVKSYPFQQEKRRKDILIV
jgi:hypothetical protein